MKNILSDLSSNNNIGSETKMSLYEKIVTGDEKISLIGLGYVGMPIAVEFAKHVPVVGFDINEKRINE